MGLRADSPKSSNSEVGRPQDWLIGGGEMGKLIRAMDWTNTPLGPIESWPQSLRTTISLCLASNFPIALVWGPRHVQIYNDGYWPICGAKHPRSMGQDFTECWAAPWPVIGEAFERALAGETSFLENQRMFLDRNGYLEETFFTFSFSPIRDESGVAGLFHPVIETTSKMLGERRTRALRDLVARAGDAKSAKQVCELAVHTLAEYQPDIPFVLVYLFDELANEARLIANHGLALQSFAAPPIVNLGVSDPRSWPLAEVARTGRTQHVDDLQSRFGGLSCGEYPESVKEALALPIIPPGCERPAGFVVAGVSSRLALNETYRAFYDLLAAAITTGVANARAYEAERKRAEALAELDRAKTVFFSNVSHEFRTPLTLMLGPLEDELAERTNPLPQERRERLATAHRNSLRLLKLVNTLLDFSRIEAGRVQAKFEPTELAQVTAELASVFRSAIEKASLTLSIDCPALPEPIYVDQEMWEKIVLNLLSNAFKHTFEGSIAVKLAQCGDHVELAVKDSGVGISSSALPHLFERFHRVEGARSRSEEGTGIGLALVKELVALHGGTIHAESEEGKGSIFTVAIKAGTAHLPSESLSLSPKRDLASISTRGSVYVGEALQWLPDPESPSDPWPRTAEAGVVDPDNGANAVSGTRRARILWADDNADMLDYVRRVLAESYDVVAVADGSTALSKALAEPPDLVLSDVMMPGLDGFALLRELRSHPRTQAIPVILLSARAGEEASIEGLTSGADDYLVKPFSAKELLARVRTHVNLARIRGEWVREVDALNVDLERRVRQRTEALRQSEGQLRLLISSVKDYAIFMLDPNGRIISWNDGAARIKGYSSEEIVGEHFSRFYPTEDQKSGKPARELQEAIEKGRFEEEGPRIRKDGSTFWANVLITAVYDDSGQLQGFSKVTRDTSHRKKLEQELQTLAAVVHNCKDFIGVCSPDMKSAYLNEAGLRMVGLDSLEAARNTHVMDYFWPEDRAMILERAMPILMREGNWRGEVRFRNFKTGEPIHTLWDAFAIRDETGQITGYATISPNLERMKQLQTALSEADKALRDTQARHAGIVSSAMDAIITVNDEQKIQVFNQAAEKMFLCPAAQALGQPLSRFIPERFRGAHRGHIHKFAENGSTSRAMGALSALWGLRGNGEEFPIEASISKMSTNGDKLFTAIVRDITERSKSAELLRRSDVTRLLALNSARLGDWQIDLQTGFATRSSLHDEIFGYREKQEEWNFDIFIKHVHPDDRERIAQVFRQGLDEQRKWDFECRILWPDQSVHWIWARGDHYKDETGKSTHVMGTVADITERKRADELRLRSQKLEGLGTLAGGIAHDFNNILLAITGNTKLAIADLPPDHPVQQSLGEIAKAGFRATDLVRRILTFSRPSEQKREVCALEPIIEEALKLVRATLPASIQFRTVFAPNLPAVLADSTQIHQIIVNLATNAAHAIGSQSDGIIGVELDCTSLSAEDINPARDLRAGSYVRLCVSDNGCGMDRATVDRIFDPFFTTKGPGEGTGLGLSVVHGIMKNHDGVVAVYSEPHRGTTFRLFFPTATDSVATVTPAEAPKLIQRETRENILYVDDEEPLVVLITRTLGRLGYKVTGQTDPIHAVELFRSNPAAFDAVVTDLSMPLLSGFDLSSQLLAIRPDLPIVMTSGFVRPEDQERALRLGLRDLILKPDTVDQLGRVLDRVFQHALTDSKS